MLFPKKEAFQVIKTKNTPHLKDRKPEDAQF